MLWLERDACLESGPFKCKFLAYETWAQLRELLGVIKNLGRQVHLIRLHGLPAAAWPTLTTSPVGGSIKTHKSTYAQRTTAQAWWQMRITDVASCIAAVRLPGANYRFQLTLTDPIAEQLTADTPQCMERSSRALDRLARANLQRSRRHGPNAAGRPYVHQCTLAALAWRSVCRRLDP